VVLPSLPGCSPMANSRQMFEGLLRLTSAIRDVAPSAMIVVCAAGRASLHLATAAATLGLHIRVGMEDTIWMWPHRPELVSDNVAMVEKAIALADVLGREVATPLEYRELMGITRHDPVPASA
jgi:3-keto-5-aminohexanoate cleavage enzyme